MNKCFYRFEFLLFSLLCSFFYSCTDLSGIESDISLLSTRVSNLEDAVLLLKKAQSESKTISSVTQTPNNSAWVVTFTDKEEITLVNAANGTPIISSINKDKNNGIISLTMSDGKIFRFNLNVSYPTSIIPIIDNNKLFLAANNTCTFKIIVNPSDAVVKTDVEGDDCSLSLVMSTKTESPFLSIDKVEPVIDSDGNVKDGLFLVTIRDLGLRTDYREPLNIELDSRNSKGDTIKVKSETISIEWCQDKSFHDFRIGDCLAKFDGNFITFHIPYGSVDFSKLKPTFKSDGKVYINNVEQKSGASEVNFRMPQEYTVVSPNGEKKTYIVSIAFSDLPVVYLQTKNNHSIDSKEVYQEDVTIYVINSEHQAKYANARVKGRGNSTWAMPKKCYTMKLDKKAEFLGLKKHKTFAFVGNYTDKTLIRNQMTYLMGRDIFNNCWSPATRNVHYVVNGEYLGLYMVVETVKTDKNRVDIPNIEDCTVISEASKYGFIVEFDLRADDNYCFVTDKGYYLSLKDPDGINIDQSLKSHIRKTVQIAENALYSSEFKQSSSPKYYGDYFNLDSFIDWLLVNEVSKVTDSNIARSYSSCYMYYDPKDARFHMGPIWDYDVAYGNYAFENSYSESIYTDGWWAGYGAWLGRMLTDVNFKKKVKQRWTEKKAELDAWSTIKTQEAADTLANDAAINFQRWPILGKYVWQNAPGSENRKTYQSEVDYLKNWMKSRISWLDSRISKW